MIAAWKTDPARCRETSSNGTSSRRCATRGSSFRASASPASSTRTGPPPARWSSIWSAAASPAGASRRLPCTGVPAGLPTGTERERGAGLSAPRRRPEEAARRRGAGAGGAGSAPPLGRRPRVGRRLGGLDVPGRREGKCCARAAGASMDFEPATVSTLSPHRVGRGPGVSGATRRPRRASSARRWPARRRVGAEPGFEPRARALGVVRRRRDEPGGSLRCGHVRGGHRRLRTRDRRG